MVLLQLARGSGASSRKTKQHRAWSADGMGDHKMESVCHTFNMPAAVILPKESLPVLWAAVISHSIWLFITFIKRGRGG